MRILGVQFLILFSLFFTGCASSEKTLKNVGNLDRVYVFHKGMYSAQPDRAALEELKELGVKTVINLRAPREDRVTFNNEKKFARELGMDFYSVPMLGDKAFDQGSIDQVYALYKQGKSNGKVLIHCSTGNRAAAWLAAHLFFHDGFSKEESIEVAQEKGLISEKMLEKISNYIESNTEK